MSDQFNLSKSQLEKLNLAQSLDLQQGFTAAFHAQWNNRAAQICKELVNFVDASIIRCQPSSPEDWALKVMAMSSVHEFEFPFDHPVADASQILEQQNSKGVYNERHHQF